MKETLPDNSRRVLLVYWIVAARLASRRLSYCYFATTPVFLFH